MAFRNSNPPKVDVKRVSDDTGREHVINHRHRNDAPVSNIDKSVSAHFPDWDKPLIKWTPLPRQGKNAKRFDLYDEEFKNIDDTSKFPARPHYTHSTTQSNVPGGRDQNPRAAGQGLPFGKYTENTNDGQRAGGNLKDRNDFTNIRNPIKNNEIPSFGNTDRNNLRNSKDDPVGQPRRARSSDGPKYTYDRSNDRKEVLPAPGGKRNSDPPNNANQPIRSMPNPSTNPPGRQNYEDTSRQNGQDGRRSFPDSNRQNGQPGQTDQKGRQQQQGRGQEGQGARKSADSDTTGEMEFYAKGTNGKVQYKADPRRDRMGQRPYHESGDNFCPNMVRGIDFLRDPRLNKGMAFTLEERQAIGIHGLLPGRFKTQEEQVRLCKENVNRYDEDLNKHIYLVGLQDRNERLFYRVLSENVEQMMPLVYTPTVGLACQKFGLIFRRPRGLFITIHDKGHIYEILKNWPENDVRAIVVTDGERILGLGDLGAYGMGIPVGKLSLYTALAGIKPSQCLPIQLDVGTNTQSLLDDPFYIGLSHKRITGAAYDDFVDEFMQAVVRRYGQNTLIQFEDFANHNAFRLLEKYRDKYCTFNDDIQGTASVALAGVLTSLRITKKKLIEQKFLFLGAGEAALGIAMLITAKMVKEGATREEAASRIFLSDSKGLLTKSRASTVTPEKQIFLKNIAATKDFGEMVKTIKPTTILGAAAAKGAFHSGILRMMADFNERPVIFALSNPTSKAECTAEEAYDNTDQRAIFASGSPFPTYEKKGKKFSPGQGNNAYIFPGVALATISAGIHHISEDVFLLAAQTLANIVTTEDLAVGRLYPPLIGIQNVSLLIAKAIVEDAYKNGEASTYPEPADKGEFVKAQLYDYNYATVIPSSYKWPI